MNKAIVFELNLIFDLRIKTKLENYLKLTDAKVCVCVCGKGIEQNCDLAGN